MAVMKKEYADFLRACKVLGCTEYDCQTPAGAACWDAAYMGVAGAADPYSAACSRCINGADYCTSCGNSCTSYEYALYMVTACSAIGKIEDAAIFMRYAESVRPAAGGIYL